jgi:membrane fusion protein (multidrug efflux system)
LARFAPILLFALALGSTACGGGASNAGGGSVPVQVDATRAWSDTVAVQINSVGSLEAKAIAQLRSEARGTVAEIRALEGERVAAGEVLVLLDDRELRARRDAAAAALNSARAEEKNLRVRVNRNDELLAAGAISPQAYDDMKTNYELAQARVQEASANLALAERLLAQTQIRAPFAGTIGQRNFYLGDLIQVGDPLYTIVDDRTLEVEFSVPERYATRIQPGNPTAVRVAGHSGERFAGTVSFVSPLVDAESRTVTAKAVVPNREGRLRAGQFADVSVALERRLQAVLVPETAIVPRSGANSVFLIRADTARLKPVEIGERQYGLTEVVSGIAAGDTVVVAGYQRLQDGSPVRVSFREPAAWREELLRERGGGRPGSVPAGAGTVAETSDRPSASSVAGDGRTKESETGGAPR